MLSENVYQQCLAENVYQWNADIVYDYISIILTNCKLKKKHFKEFLKKQKVNNAFDFLHIY